MVRIHITIFCPKEVVRSDIPTEFNIVFAYIPFDNILDPHEPESKEISLYEFVSNGRVAVDF
jgi:hypothetical protein